ncbi:MAG: hypothetical protein AAGC68_16135 [Verrucomicrobiota bacterium]
MRLAAFLIPIAIVAATSIWFSLEKESGFFFTIKRDMYRLGLSDGTVRFEFYPDDTETSFEWPRLTVREPDNNSPFWTRLRGDLYADLEGIILIGIPVWIVMGLLLLIPVIVKALRAWKHLRPSPPRENEPGLGEAE